MNITELSVLTLAIRGVETLRDDIDVIAENFPWGSANIGSIWITYKYKTCRGYWPDKRGRTMQQAFISSENDYLMEKMASDALRRIDADNVAFTEKETNRLRPESRMAAPEAYKYRGEARSPEDIKKTVCNLNSCINQHPYFRYSDKFNWHEADNPEYKTLCHVFDAVREAFAGMKCRIKADAGNGKSYR